MTFNIHCALNKTQMRECNDETIKPIPKERSVSDCIEEEVNSLKLFSSVFISDNNLSNTIKLTQPANSHSNNPIYEQIKKHEILTPKPTLKDRPLTERTRKIIQKGLTENKISSKYVSQHLNITIRTLHRKLIKEGMSFQKILDNVRIDMTIEYIKNSKRTQEEIALSLGYSDVRCFKRSLRRWSGDNFSNFKKNVLADYRKKSAVE